MYRILVIGDTHIPDRAEKIDDIILDHIESSKPYDIAVFTGDFTCSEVLEWFKGLGREAYYVRGNMDYLPLPKTAVFTVANYRIGVHHGDGVYPRGDTRQLTVIADRLGVEVLLSGHTHSPFIKTGGGGRVLHLNPGSLTGVWGGGGGSMKPSFMEVYIDEAITIKLYVLEQGVLKEKIFTAHLTGGYWRLS